MGIQSNEVLIKMKTQFEGGGAKAAKDAVDKLAQSTKNVERSSTAAAGALSREEAELAKMKRQAIEAAKSLHGIGAQDFTRLIASSRQLHQGLSSIRTLVVGGLIGGFAALSGGQLAGLFSKGIESAIQFEKNMAQVKLLTSATGVEVEKFRGIVSGMSKSTLTSTSDLAKAFFVVQSAGVQGAEALEFTDQAAKAAALGLGDVTDVVRAASTALAVFKSEGVTSSDAITGIAAAAKIGNFEVSELAGSLNKALATGKVVGAGYNDIAANIGNLSIYTGSATSAVDQLNDLFVQINQYSPQTTKVLAGVGLSAEQLKKNIQDRGLLVALTELRKRMQEVYGSTADTMASALFGSQLANNAFLNLTDNYEDNAKRLIDYNKAIGVSTDEMFDQFLSTKSGQLLKSQKELEAGLKSLAEDVMPLLAGAAKFVSDNFEELKAATVAVIVVMGVGGMASLIGTLIKSIPSLIALIRTLTGVQWGLNAAMAANPIGALIAVLALAAGALAYFYTKSETVRLGVNVLWEGVKLLGSGFRLLLDAALDVYNLLTKGDWSFSNTRSGLSRVDSQLDESAGKWRKWHLAKNGYDANGKKILSEAQSAGEKYNEALGTQGQVDFRDKVAMAGVLVQNSNANRFKPPKAIVTKPGVNPESVLSPNKSGAGRSKADETKREYEQLIKAGQQYYDGLVKQGQALTSSEGAQLRHAAAVEATSLVSKGATPAARKLAEAILFQAESLAMFKDAMDAAKGLKPLADLFPKSDDITPFELLQADDFLTAMQDMREATVYNAGLMADAFGSVGEAIGGIAVAQANAREAVAQIDNDLLTFTNENKHRQDLIDKETLRASERKKRVETEANLESIKSFKSMFSEKSKAYKVLTALETAYQAIQIAGSIKTMALDAIATAKSVGNSIFRTAVKGTEAVVTALASLPFPFNIAAGAATAAAVIGVGGSLLGSFKGGGGGDVVTAEERQAAQGAGTVLGDKTAQSNSLGNALNEASKLQNKDLEYSLSMVRSLRNIDQNIGSLASALSRGLQTGGAFDSTGLEGKSTSLGLGSTLGLSKVPIIGGIFKSLFGTTKKTSVGDFGLSLNSGALGDLVGGGVSGSTFQDVITQTKKKFFGLTTSNKTKTTTVNGALDDDFTRQVQLILASLRSGVLDAAGQLGVEGAEAVLDAFQVDLGKISFKDLTGAEIEEQLNAVFSKLGDQLAETALPAIEAFQKAGEGAFETLVRVARESRILDVALESIGKSFGAVGISSLAAREQLIGFFGDVDSLVDGLSQFSEDFLSDAERLAPIQAAVAKELDRLGLASIKTNEEFKNVVLGLDTTTKEGAELFAALINLAPAFNKVTSAADAATEAAANNAATLRGLNIDYLRLTGQKDAATALEREDILKGQTSQEIIDALKRNWAQTDKNTLAAEAAAGATSKLSRSIGGLDKTVRSTAAKPANYAANGGYSSPAVSAGRVGGDPVHLFRSYLAQKRGDPAAWSRFDDAKIAVSGGAHGNGSVISNYAQLLSNKAFIAALDRQFGGPAWREMGATFASVQVASDNLKVSLFENYLAFKDLAVGLKAFKDELLTGDQSALSSDAKYEEINRQFTQIANAATVGNLEAANQLQGVIGQYLDAAERQFGHGAGYATAFERATAALDAAAGGVTITSAQLRAQAGLDLFDSRGPTVKSSAGYRSTGLSDVNARDILDLLERNATAAERQNKLLEAANDQRGSAAMLTKEALTGVQTEVRRTTKAISRITP